MPHGCSAEHPNVSRRSAHPSIRGERSKGANPGRRNAPRERDGLFDIVRWELPKTARRRTASSVCPKPPHPEERACGSAAATQVVRARVSKDGAAIPLMLRDASQRSRAVDAFELAWAAMLLSMRARGLQNQPAAVGNDRRLRAIVSGLLFTMDSATPTCRT